MLQLLVIINHQNGKLDMVRPTTDQYPKVIGLRGLQDSSISNDLWTFGDLKLSLPPTNICLLSTSLGSSFIVADVQTV